MEKKEKRNLHFYFAHAPENSDMISFIGESLKQAGVGAEIHGRTLWERKYGFAEEEAARLQELFRCHLRKMDEHQPMSMKLRFFLSYAHEDLQDVRRFSEELNRMGLDTWIDDKDLVVGEDWIDQVFEALVSCCGIVLFFSRYFLMSDVVGYETGFFLERLKRQDGIFFCIVLPHKMDINESLRQHAHIIELYKMTSEDAAGLLVDKVIDFYKSYKQSVGSS